MSKIVKITITTNFDEGVFFFEVEEDEEVENLKALLQVESGIAIQSQDLLLGAASLDNKKTLAQSGIKGGTDVFLLLRKRVQAAAAAAGRGRGNPVARPPQPQQQQQQQPLQQARPPAQQQPDPATLMEVIRGDPATMEELSRNNPPLLEAALSGDLDKFKRILEETTRMNNEARKREQDEEEYQRMLANADPFDPVAQAKIAEYIRQKNVEENFVNALEHNPESFGRVCMLYVDCFVNGVALKAFVDSGAQSTIMSEKCAKLCNIFHLLDTRYSGTAQGVGTAKIFGRVHVAQLKIGNTNFVSSFTVIESQKGAQDLDFILGLDNLKRHQACIDLKDNVLRIGPETIKFLAEKDIPGHEESLRQSFESFPIPEPTANDNGNNNSNNNSNNNNGNSNNNANPSRAGGFPDALVQNLMNMTGVSREQVLEALRACNGNADLAMQQLTGFF